jgi:hypothetical protein
VRYFRHAISLDEHRAKFKANHWHLLKPEDEKGTKLGEMPRSNHRHPYFHHRNHDQHKDKSHSEEEYDDGHLLTNVLEVWFSGCHCGNALSRCEMPGTDVVVVQTLVGDRSRTANGTAWLGFHFVG